MNQSAWGLQPEYKPYSYDGSEAEKTAFAAAWLRDKLAPWQAAQEVFPGDSQKCLFVGNNWPSDPFVLAETRRLKDELGEMAFLPSKAEAARKAWELATNESMKATVKERVDALRLFGEICGHIDKTPKLANGKNEGSKVVQIVASKEDEAL